MIRIKVLAAFLAATAVMATGANAQGYVEGRLLVKFKESATEAQKIKTIGLANGHVKQDGGHADLTVIELPKSASLRAQINALKQRPDVEFVEPDYIYEPDLTPNDPQFGGQWHHQRIASPSAWDRTQGSPNVTIAILDSGVAGFHADLANQMVPGWNFYDNNSDTNDVYGHGTKVAGAAAAATNNLTGVSGVGFNCKIMPLRVTSTSGSASASALASGLRWAADRGARVANVSFNAASSSAVIDAANYFMSKGGVVTMSAGNNATFNNQSDIASILTVSATNSGDGLSGFSNTGNLIDCGAPGEGITTTTSDGGYAGVSGTSFAAPVTAGVAALMFSANPNLSGSQCMDLLRRSGDDLGIAGWDPAFGFGRVNAQRSVDSAMGTAGQDNTAPTVSFASPTNGGQVGGVITLFVNASDNTSVERVELFVNNQYSGTKASAPYSWGWNTATVADGNHSLKAVAFDTAGNSAQTTITVNVRNATADVTAPSVTFTSPSNGATVSGAVNVSVGASDNVGVTRVDFFVNNQFSGSKSSGPYNWSWDTSAVANGNHTLKAVAYDAAGNSAQASVGVSVQNSTADVSAPNVSFSSPSNGATISGTVNVAVSASDNVGVTRVDFFVNNQYSGSKSSGPYTWSWDTTAVGNGNHTLKAVAYDAAGNSAETTIQVGVQNTAGDSEAPTAEITSPGDGETAGNRLMITANASDNVGVVKVELWVDGKLEATDTSAAYSWNINTRKWKSGTSHTLQVKAFDAAGNVGYSSVVNVRG